MTTIVVGAGLSGLVHAYALARRGLPVRLLEESNRVGGLVRTEHKEGFLLELGPNTVRPTVELWDLIVDLGLKDQAVLADHRSVRSVDLRGRLRIVPMSPFSFVTTSLLSWKGKLRLLAEPFVRRGDPLHETVRSFFSRRLGSEVVERLVEPFVFGIFAGDASKLSVAACFPQLARWERERGSLLVGALAPGKRKRRAPVRGLLSFREGLATLPEAIASRLSELLQLETRVESIRPSSNAWKVRTSRGDMEASRVVLAVPAPRAARLVEAFSPSAAGALDGIPHPPLAVLHLSWPADAFSTPLRGFGHLVASQLDRRILGAVYSSSLLPDRAPQGQTLLTVFLGGARDPEAAGLSDSELVDLAARDLRAALAMSGAPRVLAVTRYRKALPQYDLAHEARMIALREAEANRPGLFFLGNYRGGVSVGDVVRNALEAADPSTADISYAPVEGAVSSSEREPLAISPKV